MGHRGCMSKIKVLVNCAPGSTEPSSWLPDSSLVAVSSCDGEGYCEGGEEEEGGEGGRERKRESSQVLLT